MSHIHVGCPPLTPLVQTLNRRLRTDVFRTQDGLIRRAMGRLLHEEQVLFDQRVIMRVSCLQQVR